MVQRAKNKILSLFHVAKSNFAHLKNNPVMYLKHHRYISVVAAVLVLFIIASCVIFASSYSDQKEIVAIITPTPSQVKPTVTPLTATPTTQVNPVIYVSPIPTISTKTSVRIIIKTKSGGEDISQSVKIELKAADGSFTSTREKTTDATFEDLKEATYETYIDLPSSYYKANISSNGDISEKSECNVSFSLKKGTQKEITCTIEKYPGSNQNYNNTSTGPSGPAEIQVIFPQNGQAITGNANYSVCIVSTPVKNTDGAQMKYSINGGEWTQYGSIAPCFKSPIGSVDFKYQIKNSANFETSQMSLNFTYSE